MSTSFKQQQNTLRAIVFEVLTDYPETRVNDVELVLRVLAKLNVNTGEPFVNLARSGKLCHLESITRHRRQLLLDYPELKVVSVRERRKLKEEKYHEYFSHYKENLIV